MGVQKYLKGSRKLFHRSKNFFLMVENFLVNWELILSVENFFFDREFFVRREFFWSIENFFVDREIFVLKV